MARLRLESGRDGPSVRATLPAHWRPLPGDGRRRYNASMVARRTSDLLRDRQQGVRSNGADEPSVRRPPARARVRRRRVQSVVTRARALRRRARWKAPPAPAAHAQRQWSRCRARLEVRAARDHARRARPDAVALRVVDEAPARPDSPSAVPAVVPPAPGAPV